MKLKAFAALAAAFALSAAPAQAATLLFTITGDLNAQFELESSPTPDLAVDGFLFVINGISGFPGATTGLADVGFYNGNFGGGMLALDSATDGYLLDAPGPQLFSGTESAPTFVTGIYELTGLLTPGNFTLTIASITPVPEPASWALMIGGMALAGAALRRRPTVRVQMA